MTPLGIDGRRSTVPFFPGRASPEPIPLPSCQPVTPVASTAPLLDEAASPGLLPDVDPARPVVVRPRDDCPGRTVNCVFASTQISQPMWRWRGHRREGGELDVSGSEPIAYSDRMYSLGTGFRGDRGIPGSKAALERPASGTRAEGRTAEAGTLGSGGTTGALFGGSGARREKKSFMTVASARRRRTPFGSLCWCCLLFCCGCREGDVGGSRRSSGCIGRTSGGWSSMAVATFSTLSARWRRLRARGRSCRSSRSSSSSPCVCSGPPSRALNTRTSSPSLYTSSSSSKFSGRSRCA